jgi:serine/threonine-protein kinase
MLWEMLVGRPLFGGDSEGEIIERILFDEVAPPSAHTEAISPALDAVVMRAIARSPDARFASAAEMAQALCEAMPPAPRTDVVALLARRCGPELEQKRARARELETMALAERAAPTPPGARPSSPSSDARSWRRGALLLAGVAIVAGASVYALVGRAPAPPVLAGTDRDLAPREPSPPTVASAASSPDLASAAAPTSTLSAAPKEAPPRGPPQPPRRVVPVNKETSCAKVAPDGTKQFDRECLKRKAQ